MPSVATLCRFCREKLEPGAVYCAKCEQFQTFWPRFRSEITLSALLGALPMLALVYGFVRDHSVAQLSEIKALAVECGTGDITAGISNAGNRPALVAGGDLAQMTSTGAQTSVTHWRLFNSAPKGALIIEPAKPLVAGFTIGDAATGQPPRAMPGQSCTYRVALQVMDYGAKAPRQEEFSCACPAT